MSSSQLPQFRRRPTRSLAAVAFVGALALSACGDGNGDDPESPSPGTGAATAAPPVEDGDEASTLPADEEAPAEDPTSPMGDPDATMKENMEFTGGDLSVSDIRLATHDDFDRVVFDVAGDGAPGWTVTPTDAPVQQGSGSPIDYEGASALSVNLHGMAQPLEVGDVAGVGGVVTEVIPDISHHGTAQFIIGLQNEAPFSVTLLDEPTRVVVDVLHE